VDKFYSTFVKGEGFLGAFASYRNRGLLPVTNHRDGGRRRILPGVGPTPGFFLTAGSIKKNKIK
jgi:hypothetical protein